MQTLTLPEIDIPVRMVVTEHKITDVEALKKFSPGGYKFDREMSTDNNLSLRTRFPAK